MMLRWIFALMLVAALPSAALAQDATDDQPSGAPGSEETPVPDQTPGQTVTVPMDDEVLQGLWHVDHVEGSAANDTMSGSLLKIDRQAITSLTGGTCSSPTFVTLFGPTVGVDVMCLGQLLASARWSDSDPGAVIWTEPNLEVVLHRVRSATTAEKPASTDDSSGEGDDAQ